MADDGGQVSIAHFVECVALGKRARLDLEIVVVGNALRRGFWIVAARTKFVIELESYLLLIAQRNFFKLQIDGFLSFRRCTSGQLISACHAALRRIARWWWPAHWNRLNHAEDRS